MSEELIDINDGAFDENASGLFNDNKGGIAENCELDRIEKKSEEDKENYPDYNFYFKDAQGNETKLGRWYPDFSQSKDKNKAKIAEGKFLNHLLHTFISPTTKAPKAESWSDLLDKVVEMLENKGKPHYKGKKIALALNFGTTSKAAREYAELRRFPPFAQTMEDFQKNPTKLAPKNIEHLAPGVPGGGGPSSPDSLGDMGDMPSAPTV